MGRPIPEENELSFDMIGLIALCKSYQTLPGPGGILDQDSFFIYAASIYEQAAAERDAKQSSDAQSRANQAQSQARRR